MVRNCCVPQCNSTFEYGNNIKCHLFPKDTVLKKKWVHVLRLGRDPTMNQVVCGKHFVESDYFSRGEGKHAISLRLKHGSIPSVNLPKLQLELLGVIKPKMKRKAPFSRENIDPITRKRRNVKAADAIVVASCENSILSSAGTNVLPRVYGKKITKETSSHSHSPLTNESEIPTSSETAFEVDPLNAYKPSNECEVALTNDAAIFENDISSSNMEFTTRQTGTQTSQATSNVSTQTLKLGRNVGTQYIQPTHSLSTQTTPQTQRLSYSSLEDSEILYLTGLPRPKFEVIFAMLEKFNPLVGFTLEIKKNMLLVAMYKIRHNLDFKMIELMFMIGRNQISSIFKEVVEKLYMVMKGMDIWKISFKSKKFYRTILDCTEMFVVRMDNPNIHQLSYSNYKSRPTFKVLVGCDEKGAVNFISDLFPGSSDREIVIKSGILDIVSTDEAVMADKGFDISDLFENKGVLLNNQDYC